jgi:pimeloyl-ACP methyl ester carboxylesterase
MLPSQTRCFTGRQAGTEAVALFMRFVGTSAEMIEGIRQSPAWAQLTAVAHTLPYDAAARGDRSVPANRGAAVIVPTLVMNGSESPHFLATTAEALTWAIPNAEHMTLEGQRHNA